LSFLHFVRTLLNARRCACVSGWHAERAAVAPRTRADAARRIRHGACFSGMNYHRGDLVYPTDLPQRFLCRIVEAQDVRITTGRFQILQLEPVEGPWAPGTVLVREGDTVCPATAPSAVTGHAA
jgi:hypothetical protein